jgi:hypothetical protein
MPEEKLYHVELKVDGEVIFDAEVEAFVYGQHLAGTSRLKMKGRKGKVSDLVSGLLMGWADYKDVEHEMKGGRRHVAGNQKRGR